MSLVKWQSSGYYIYMNYWLVKADPDSDYSIEDLERDGETIWDGVHSNPAILNIQKMKLGDLVYIYHSQKQKAIVGLAEVAEEPFENKADPRRSWAVKLKFVRTFTKTITLAAIKSDPEMQQFGLVRQSRLSVMPVPGEIQHKLTTLVG
ncbi:MAG: EVE domain-containing protein [Candidatus Saccharibacteria bacterium]|nr:EVE domain-containing protein [Candidatus Saccharibacteria bacterium]